MSDGPNIVIVDDNELNMKLFRDLLAAPGYLTLETNDGAKAFDLAREHRPDLVLMDIQLPNVPGLEIITPIKPDAELKSIPVAAVSAFATKWNAETLRELGCEAYLAKPITVTSFIEAVETALR